MLETIFAALGVLYVVVSFLAGILPAGSKAQALCAKLALALKGASSKAAPEAKSAEPLPAKATESNAERPTKPEPGKGAQ